MGIQHCRIEIENSRGKLDMPPKNQKNSSFSFDSQNFKKKTRYNNLVIFTFLCYLRLYEHDTAIKFFNSNYSAPDKEIALYVLLRLLFVYKLKDQWVQVYDTAVKANVKPRNQLVEIYNYIQQSGKFPDYMWASPNTGCWMFDVGVSRIESQICSELLLLTCLLGKPLLHSILVP